MQQIELEVKARVALGSSASRRMRKDGLIPAVVYAHGEDSMPSTLDQRQFVKVASVSRSSQLFVIKSDDKRLNGRSALVKSVQKDYQRNSVVHVDLLAVREDKELTVTVPVKLVGESPGVKNDGAILAFVSHEIEVLCLPKYIPEELKVDISNLNIAQSIHANQLVLPEGVKLAGNPDLTIVSVVAARSSAEEESSQAAQGDAAATPAAATDAAKDGAKDK